MKLLDFLDFLYRNTDNEQIKWEENEAGIMTSNIGGKTIILKESSFTIDKFTKNVIDMDTLSSKIYKKLWKILHSEERLYDKIVDSFKKTA